jgi:uncharacterized protein (DUF58 family)
MNDPKEILRKIRRLELRTRRLVESSFAGQYQSVFKGRGMNFEEVRPYTPGDEIRAIDWNVTARTGEPYIKKFTEEREMTVMIVLDVSASGDFGSVEGSKREMAAEVAAILAFSAIHNNDKVGLLLFSDRVELFMPPKKGRHHILRLIREMLYFTPKGRGTDLAGALEYLNKIISRSSLLFLISDFLAPDFSRPLTVTAKRHDTVALRIVDPAEERLPDVGVVLLQDPETGEQIEVDTSRHSVTEGFARFAADRGRELGLLFGARGVDPLQLHTDRDYLPVLRGFFERRGRRLAA